MIGGSALKADGFSGHQPPPRLLRDTAPLRSFVIKRQQERQMMFLPSPFFLSKNTHKNTNRKNESRGDEGFNICRNLFYFRWAPILIGVGERGLSSIQSALVGALTRSPVEPASYNATPSPPAALVAESAVWQTNGNGASGRYVQGLGASLLIRNRPRPNVAHNSFRLVLAG